MTQGRVFPDPQSRSAAIYARAREFLPGGNTRTTVYMEPYQIYAAKGEGCIVWDADGTPRIDCINNFTAAIHGYAHPVITKVAQEQAALGTAFGLATPSEIDLAELLVGRVASVEQCRFMNSGTEAVMSALKAARAFTGRPKIAKCEGAYHGTYDYAEVSLDPDPAASPSNAPTSVAYARGTPQGVLDDVVVLPFNDIEQSVAILRAHRDSLAAVLIDPMPNRAGLVPADRAYIQALREVASEIGALLIFDEVISFRLGFHGAQEIWGVEADLTAFGKIIGGGFPIGAVGGRRSFMSVFDPTGGKPKLPQGGTFSANPMAMRCGLAAMDLLDHAAFETLNCRGETLRASIDESFRKAGIPGHTTGMGSLLKLHFTRGQVRDYRSARPDAEAARKLNRLTNDLLNHGVIMANYGLMALSTPMTDADIATVGTAIEHCLARLAS